jgi:hypothetical protein
MHFLTAGERTSVCRTIWIIAALLLAPAAVQSADQLQAGAAKRDITPPVGYPMWGYASRRDHPASGVLDRLYARALVLVVGSERVAIVSLDLGRAPTRQSTASIRARTKAEARVEHLFLVASHTHHGPVLELDDWPTPETSYVRCLERMIAEAIIEAAQNVRPAMVGFASKHGPFNHNRHSRLPDKPLDNELLVLRVEGKDGKPIAHAVNFAAHPTLTESKLMQFSADYPGALAVWVEGETLVPCLFLQGAAGDLSPDSSQGRDPQVFGRLLGREVITLIRTMVIKPSQEASLCAAEDDFCFKSRIDHGNPLVKMLFARAFFSDLVSFYVREYESGIRPHLTTALLDGTIGFVGVSGEFFCGHSLGLKRRSRLDALFFLGYCNDYQQYFPTIEAAAEGGTGADPHIAPAEVGAGEQVINRALIRLYQLQGKLPQAQGGK